MLDGITLDKMLLCVPVYALCTTNKKTEKLTARYYTLQLTHGPEPIWGVWTVKNKFVCEVTKLEGLKRRYPKLARKRLSATLGMTKPLEEREAKAEREMLATYYKGLGAASKQDNKRAKAAGEVTSAVTENPVETPVPPVLPVPSEPSLVSVDTDVSHAA